MFDILIIAKKIKENRCKKNLTQMQLADLLGISYQAVSNWERGNSMPDIAKWEELANIFEVNIDEILGCNAETSNIKKYINFQKEEEGINGIEWDELIDIVEFIEPETIRKIVESKYSANEKISIGVLQNLLPYVAEETTSTLVNMVVENVNLEVIYQVAPFLKKEDLENLIKKCDFSKENEVTHICNLMPFLSRKLIADIISKYEGLFCLDDMIQIAPFSDEEIMEILIKKMDINGGLDNLIRLAPFLPQFTLENLIVELVKQGYLKDC